jgi:TrmH family RNA methyltransferase
LHDISDELMEKASTTVTSQGIFAVCRQASCRPNYETTRNVLTIVDAVQDPGNLGTLFRTSLGFSSGGMILGKGTVSPFNPKVVRGSSGTFLRVPFESDVDLIDKINFLRQKGYLIVATDLHARQSLRDLPPRKLRKVAFLVGNEGAGTNAYLIELADETVKIPMSSDLESLNVAVAHGILSYELAQLQKEI